MTVIHLQLDIDSEVHPELHDMLCLIGSSRAQAERLRQLAATGLVWERLRLQAYGRIEVPDLALQPAPAPARGVDSVPEQTAASVVQVLPAAGTAATARSAEMADFVDLSDAVDLAHLDSPAPPAAEVRPAEVAEHQTAERLPPIAAARLLPGGAPEPLPLHEIRSAVQALPVLTEVVAAAELPNMDAVAVGADAHDAHEEATAAYAGRAGAQIHELAPARKNATRSRLLRMKDKGLFKNE
ncbi:MAG TPA: hypothetical protein VEC14_08065 [Reyranellaceae bacterium]|nr:hypothetical protein [Reyranellaceae bacterium]